MKQPRQILIVDDDQANLARMEQALAPLGCTFVKAADGAAALATLARLSGAQGFPGIVITDLKMPVMNGMELLIRAQQADGDLPVILISAYGEITSAVEAMKSGAYDFLERPFDVEDIRSRASRALEKRDLVLENRGLRAELANRPGLASRIIGNSAGMQKLREDVANVAGTDVTVLIQGATGTGKEVVARALHEFGSRARARFVAINCGGLSENIIESELFGHEPGAFTDAKQRRIGLIEHAKAGTLFLDEVESMPMNFQVKLLRMLQERVITRVGSNDVIKVDIRVIAATKSNLREAANRNAFREDLYYRLNVAEIHIPALNERREDILLLFDHFVREFAGRYQREVQMPSGDDAQRLMAHNWRGNVRELRNIAERFVLALGARPGGLGPLLDSDGGRPKTLPDQIDAIEAVLIRAALVDAHGNIQATADALGLPRRTLNEKMRKYNLDRHEHD